MPYLPTTQAFLEQSALLLEAYPETVRYHAQSHMAIPPSISTAHATQYLSPHSHHQLPILISPTSPQTPKQKKHIPTSNIHTPKHHKPHSKIKLTTPDSHHNKIQLPNRTPRPATQARKVPCKETSNFHNRNCTHRIHTKRAHCIPHPENLQPRHRRMPEVSHKQAAGG